MSPERDYTFDDRWGGIAGGEMDADRDVKVTANYSTPIWTRCRTSASRTTHVAKLSVHLARRSARHLLRLRQPRLPETQQDIGTLNGAGRRQRLRHARQQIPRRTVGSQLYRHHSRAGSRHRQPCTATAIGVQRSPARIRRLDGLSQSSEPLSGRPTCLADQSAATIKFDTGPVRNTVVTGIEISRET